MPTSASTVGKHAVTAGASSVGTLGILYLLGSTWFANVDKKLTDHDQSLGLLWQKVATIEQARVDIERRIEEVRREVKDVGSGMKEGIDKIRDDIEKADDRRERDQWRKEMRRDGGRDERDGR